jgi:antitoxin (DNA-binding transcriptional repressor) of toxin-antitoxin stability system
MTQIALDNAREQLPELVAAVEQGVEFVMTLGGKPVAKVSPAPNPRPTRRFGSSRGKIVMSDDFDAPLDEFAEYM